MPPDLAMAAGGAFCIVSLLHLLDVGKKGKGDA
jgi:hypothetical protein